MAGLRPDVLWLVRALRKLRPVFRTVGYPLPAGGVGLCVATCSNPDWYGEYYPPSSMAPLFVVKVSPKNHRGSQAMQILVHELCHVAADFKTGVRNGHGDVFQDAAERIGLMRNGSASYALRMQCRAWARQLGPWRPSQ